MVSRSTSVFARSVSQNDMRCVARGLIIYKFTSKSACCSCVPDVKFVV